MDNTPLKVENAIRVRVRYAETDKMGVVYHSNYLVYCEVARVELMRACGLPYIEFENQGYMMPLIESHVNYHSSAFFDDELKILATLNFELKPSIRIEYNISRNDTTIATGYTVHSFMHAVTRKAVRPPKSFIDSIIRTSNNHK